MSKKNYHFNLQDSSYLITLNITKKKHLSDPELLKNTSQPKPSLFKAPKTRLDTFNEANIRPKSRLEKVTEYDYNKRGNDVKIRESYKPNKATNLNLNLESNRALSNKFKIEISPCKKNVSNYHKKYINNPTETINKVNKYAMPLSSRSNYAHRRNEMEFEPKYSSRTPVARNYSKTYQTPSVFKRSQSVNDDYIKKSREKSVENIYDVFTHKHRVFNYQPNSLAVGSSFSLEKPSYTTDAKDSHMSESMLSILNKNYQIYNDKRLSLLDSSNDLTEISGDSLKPSRKPAARQFNYSSVKKDLNRAFVNNQTRHQETVKNNNKIFQHKHFVSDEKPFSLVESNVDSVRGMGINELSNYIDNLIHQFRLKANLSKMSDYKSEAKNEEFKFDENDIVESIIISEGIEAQLGDDETKMNLISEDTLSQLNNNNERPNEDDNEEEDDEEEENKTLNDSERDESVTFINYTHSYELEELESDSELSFSQSNDSNFENEANKNSGLTDN